MKQFSSIPEAFEWWLKNIYPTLPAEVKKGKPVSAWRDYTHGGGISEKRMREILIEFGHFKIEMTITYEP
ncbi:hypothetical protein [Dyadobacter aurulentus]|uniref:hypothetical protein n=1 Tax=Dyadobacter sp. UC 10 TaxID=2605428 RepID=UPI0011F3DBB8|nr:hypothetical protein [Dyadobacter sp. UC 10]KAA0990067.1 hypothetical protein FXO21_07795 [Dyadobacter sp. UC 10]